LNTLTGLVISHCVELMQSHGNKVMLEEFEVVRDKYYKT